MAKKKKKGAPGGKRPGAGRPKGSLSKITKEAVAKAQAEGYLPLDYMLRVMRDARSAKPRRDAMAMAAAPYLHHKLSAIQMTGPKGGPVQIATRQMTPKEAAEAYASTLAAEDISGITSDDEE
jgi:hypothetical protein